ncbi:sensor histidine kinase [Promicromonospora soli]|uniref:Two-component sensor histidine kinase n=1 Tax=Promicromonospora soli TaxID=2035533 RepID=A0A919FTE6_9MICO|nr:sensor histidine kinase [Promicromonospora soli]GHH72008.1 two-component sensor histidine kinase [Promicromonospora soli]
MTTDDGAAHGERAVESLHAGWDQQVRWWDAAFYVIVALTAVALLLEGTRGVQLAVAFGAMAAIVVAYLLWGAKAARTRDQRLAGMYLVVLVLGTGVTVSQAGVASLLLFIAFAQLWMLLESIRYGVIGCAVLAVVVAFGIAARFGFDPAVVGEVVPQMLVTLVFSIGLGLWFHVAMQRAEEHARLLGELQAAQSELARTNHEAGVTAERERLAREIHDTLAQGFTSVIMQAQAAAAALDVKNDDAVRERLHVVEETARDNLAEARALVAAFAPVALQDASLPQALGRLGTRFAEETGLIVRVEAEGVGALPPAVEVVLLRAAQEAFANVRRHAQAGSVVVRLGQAGGEVTLTVSDDGRGLGPDAADGFGLAGMRDRVRSAGGTLAVGPGEDGGTTLCARVPVDAQVDARVDARVDAQVDDAKIHAQVDAGGDDAEADDAGAGSPARAHDGTQGVAR